MHQSTSACNNTHVQSKLKQNSISDWFPSGELKPKAIRREEELMSLIDQLRELVAQQIEKHAAEIDPDPQSLAGRIQARDNVRYVRTNKRQHHQEKFDGKKSHKMN
jgi:hypothetical protein